MVCSTAVETTFSFNRGVHFVVSVCDKLRNALLDLMMMIVAGDFSMQKDKEIYTHNCTYDVL